jgi:hypothetical protein
MAVRAIIDNVVFVACVLSVLAGSLVHLAMIKQVNARLPKEHQFSYFGRSAHWELRLRSEYRRFYPDGKMPLAVRTLVGVAIACALCFLGLHLGSA